MALNAYGAALLALGRFEDAERYLRAALEIEPLLSDAAQNLSVALICRDRADQPPASCAPGSSGGRCSASGST